MKASPHTLKSSSAALAKELEEACRKSHFEQAVELVPLIEAEYQTVWVIYRQEFTSSPKEAA